IVNENDTVATHEIRFGDNDRLAALVAQLIGADALVLLSDIECLYTAPPSEPGARPITDVEWGDDLSEYTFGSVTVNG
ncbi:glutamate 5-kinase, partial [Staphylococcus aureus]